MRKTYVKPHNRKESGWKKMIHAGHPMWLKGTKAQGWDIPKDNVQIDIYQRVQGKNRGKYQVQIWYASNNRVISSKLYTTKSQALKFAKSYMRTH